MTAKRFLAAVHITLVLLALTEADVRADILTNFRLTAFLQPDKKPPTAPERGVLGFQSCALCHNSGIKGSINVGGVEIPLQQEQWVLYKELPIWAEQDKHVQSYTVLLNERSKAMGKLLGVSEVHRDRRCLACHTGFPLHLMPAEKDGLVDPALGKKFDINLGVSCEGCHGPSGDSKADDKLLLTGWFKPHQEPPALPYDKTNPWRYRSPHEKRDKFGFTDVRSPTSKTKLCLSCHLGDVEQGRMVTHEMYAAGHPPLPGFEVESFVAQMPRHWAEFSAKSDEVQDLFLKFTKDSLFREPAFKKKSLQRTRTLLTGALVVSSEYLRLTAQLADETVQSPVKKIEWPELAAFDCYACHHELKHVSWRQIRKAPVGTPGRPPLQDWPFTLARIALKSLGTPTADADAKLADVRKALGAQPFGNAKDLVKPAQLASSWFSQRSMEMEKKPISRAEGVSLLKEIASAAATEIHDYQSARQLMWAFQIIQADLKNDYSNAKQVAKALEPMSKEMFLLDLRTGRNAMTAVSGDPKARSIVEVDLDVALPFLSRYQPAQFQARFKEIHEFLK